MKVVTLSKGHYAQVDDADYERVAQHNWCVQDLGTRIYACRNVRREDGSRTHEYLRRFILATPLEHIDHKDGNGLNCQRHNLRGATRSQNYANRKRSRANTSGFKGVVKHGGVWTAQIGVFGRRVYLGSFATARQAAEAYDLAALILHGEFAQMNVVQ